MCATASRILQSSFGTSGFLTMLVIVGVVSIIHLTFCPFYSYFKQVTTISCEGKSLPANNNIPKNNLSWKLDTCCILIWSFSLPFLSSVR
jgi:hypothetical protein